MNLPLDKDAAKATATQPKTKWDKIITATPVVMTVLATVLAGLSSSEMNQAQYFRSIAAQQQSKASDQWALFQAKRQRAVSAAQTAQLIETLGDAAPFSMAELALPANATTAATAQPAMSDADVRAAAEQLHHPVMPRVAPPFDDPAIKAAYDALRAGASETADPALFARVNDKSLHEALRKSEERTQSGEGEIDPAAKGMDRLADLVNQQAAHAPDAERGRRMKSGFTVARLRFEDAREHSEAELNQVTAYLYEIAVHKSSIESTRHRTRSFYFFFGMLGAQAAVTLATIAIAARERSTIWTLAATIGVVAVAYAGYVYLFT